MEILNKKIQEKFNEMSATGKLFRVAFTGQEIWDLYLKSFSEENDPVFRDPNSTTHNCNLCNNFIRRYGNIVSIDKNYNITSMFDVDLDTDDEYKDSMEALATAIKNSTVKEVFFETFEELKKLPYESCKKTNIEFQLGVSSNVKRYTKEESEKFGVVKPNELRTFNHFHLSLNRNFVDFSGSSIESLMGIHRDAKQVFQRAMETISVDTLELVKDLIKQNSLLDGATHLHKIEKILPLKKEYDTIPTAQRNNWCWVKSYNLPIAKFRNELIGVLCSELSEGEDINKACESWNKRVDPVNYMKVKAPITQKQINEAKEYCEKNGYIESFERRFATMHDIKSSEILHSNVNAGIKSISIFDSVKSSSTQHKRNQFDGIMEITIDKFMEEILPKCSSVEAFLDIKHQKNLVSLTTAIGDPKPIFKWDNNYSWTFNGNLAGVSQIKEAVKIKGGNVEGVLRFSLIWNESGSDGSDLDAWCEQPDGQKIGFSAGFRRDSGNRVSSCSGQLDLDNTTPGGKLAVENIYFADIKKMRKGVYKFWVHQYNGRNSQGFKAEIEFDGESFVYEYNRPVSGIVKVAEVTLDKNFTIKHNLKDSTVSSKEIYGLKTNQFHKVNLVCLSPNHWGNNNIGNKHYFFMLENCKSPTAIRGFHNENLLPELLTHRKVLEVLGATKMIDSTDNQLSGLGFNATVKDSLIVKLQGTHKRILKINF